MLSICGDSVKNVNFRTRKRKSKTRKYGLITSSGNDLEMEPLDQDLDEDEDMTVFEMNNRGKK